MCDDHITRRAAAEWLTRVGGTITLGASALAALAGCTSTSARRQRTVTVRDETVYTPRTRSRPPADVNNTPGAKALERWRTQTRQTPLPSGVVPRAMWAKGGPIPTRSNPMGRISRITVHHDGMNAFTSVVQANAMRRIESIRRAHVGSEQWADIGYHYVIDPAGRVYEARPVSIQGAHVKYNNEGNLGVMMLGNFNKQRPSPAALASLDAFVTSQARIHGVSASSVYTHQELRPTACPGRNLQRHMDDARTRRGAITLALA
ncbi:MAG: peptidoglycan recognition family protein [Planctomycetota bacterium]